MLGVCFEIESLTDNGIKTHLFGPTVSSQRTIRTGPREATSFRENLSTMIFDFQVTL